MLARPCALRNIILHYNDVVVISFFSHFSVFAGTTLANTGATSGVARALVTKAFRAILCATDCFAWYNAFFWARLLSKNKTMDEGTANRERQEGKCGRLGCCGMGHSSWEGREGRGPGGKEGDAGADTNIDEREEEENDKREKKTGERRREPKKRGRKRKAEGTREGWRESEQERREEEGEVTQ